MNLTGPDKFFGKEEQELIEAIENCFTHRNPHYQKRECGEVVLVIGISGEFPLQSRRLVALMYEAKGWRKVTTKTSEEHGERKGITYMIFHI